MAISKYRCTEKWKLVKHRVCEQHWWVKRVKKLKAITLDTCSWTDTKCENKESTCHAYRSVFDKYEVELDTSSVTRGRAWSIRGVLSQNGSFTGQFIKASFSYDDIWSAGIEAIQIALFMWKQNMGVRLSTWADVNSTKQTVLYLNRMKCSLSSKTGAESGDLAIWSPLPPNYCHYE